MNNIITMAAEEPADAELVVRSAAGDREAFGRIVMRHQTLICSLAYCATGNIAQSEDLAQETFVAAWREICRLRAPEKLRPWLCGIARNTINSRRRSLRREPVHGASELNEALEAPAPEPPPSEQAVSRERETIVWQALERIPEKYREPLILFYRQHKSVEHVAADLGLSEDAVRQRLSRGRKLLHEQVAAVVEDTLGLSTPGVMFTTAVVGALPLVASAMIGSAAGAGTVLAKGGANAAATKLAAWFSFVIGPLLGLLAAWVSVRASIRAMKTRRERSYLKKYYGLLGGGILVFAVVSGVLAGFAKARHDMPPGFVVLCLGSAGAYAVFLIVVALRTQRDMRTLRTEERLAHPDAFIGDPQGSCGPFLEYRSRLTLLGLPLLHVRMGTPLGEKMKAAIGWIAVGDCAFGVLFAVGGISMGCFSLGGLAIGAAASGGLSIGGIAVGGLVFGGLAVGGIAAGFIAEGFNAFGWLAAQGWYAAAHDFALGRHTWAAHANDTAAAAWFSAHGWFDLRTVWGKALIGLCWLPSVWLLVQHRDVWRLRLKDRTNPTTDARG